MSARDTLESLITDWPDEKIDRVVEFVRFLQWSEDRAQWQAVAMQGLSLAYGDDEPEYTAADIKRPVES